MPDVPADFKVPAEGMMLDGILLFGEGSKRGLAAAACWLSLLVAFKTKDIESKFDEPQVVLLLTSLLRQGSVGTGCQHLRFYSLRKPPFGGHAAGKQRLLSCSRLPHLGGYLGAILNHSVAILCILEPSLRIGSHLASTRFSIFLIKNTVVMSDHFYFWGLPFSNANHRWQASLAGHCTNHISTLLLFAILFEWDRFPFNS